MSTSVICDRKSRSEHCGGVRQAGFRLVRSPASTPRVAGVEHCQQAAIIVCKMNDSVDIRRLLQGWPPDPEKPARIVPGEDGREILQVRTPLGLEQLEMEGRPDGARPHGEESELEFQLKRFERARAAGEEAEFELSSEECAELFSEGTLYYFRYLHRYVERDPSTSSG